MLRRTGGAPQGCKMLFRAVYLGPAPPFSIDKQGVKFYKNNLLHSLQNTYQ